MPARRPFSIVGGAVVCLLLSYPALAQKGRPGHLAGRAERPAASPHDAALEDFESMPPEQRERELAKLPPDRSAKLRRQLQYYDQLTPAQKQQFNWFNHLPPERQEAFRKAFRKFQAEPAARQQSMREEMGRLRSMSAAERKARLSSPEFQSQFTKNERQILGQMSDALPQP